MATTYDIYIDRSVAPGGAGTVGDPYASLGEAENAEQGNGSTGDTFVFRCTQNGGAADDYVEFAGWTTAGLYIQVVGTESTPYHIDVTTGYKSGFRITTGAPTSGYILTNLDIKSPPSSGAGSGVLHNAVTAPLLLINSRVHGCKSAGVSVGVPSTITIINSFIYGNAGNGITSSYNTGPPTTAIYNSTIYGNGGYGVQRGSGTLTIKNSYIGNNTSGNVTGTVTADYNVFSDATGAGTNKAVSQDQYADYFVSVTGGSEDFHLKDTATNLWGIAGSDQTAAFATAGISPPVDMAGVTRTSGAFGIGALLYVVAGGGGFKPFWAMNCNKLIGGVR